MTLRVKQTSVSSPTYAVGGKAKTKAYAGGGFVEGFAQGLSSGYGMGSKSDGEKKPSKLALRLDDGSTVADNVRSGAKRLKDSILPGSAEKPEGSS